MSQEWTSVAASEVTPGDRVRLAGGQELIASRIEPRFFGLDNLVAFIEDTPDRWFKQPVPTDAQVEILRPT